jgi:hypothetical protein
MRENDQNTKINIKRIEFEILITIRIIIFFMGIAERIKGKKRKKMSSTINWSYFDYTRH